MTENNAVKGGAPWDGVGDVYIKRWEPVFRVERKELNFDRPKPEYSNRFMLFFRIFPWVLEAI